MFARTRDGFAKARATANRSSQGRRELTIEADFEQDFEPVRPKMEGAIEMTAEIAQRIDTASDIERRTHNSS